MRFVFSTIRACLLASACFTGGLVATTAAVAGPIFVQVRDGNGGDVFNGGPGSVQLQIGVDGSNANVLAGAFALQWRFNSPGSDWVNFLTYCLEPNEYLNMPGNGTPVTGELQENIAATEYASVAATLTQLYDAWFQDSLTSRIKSAAFQVAVWEIAHENGLASANLASGRFRLQVSGAANSETNRVITQANSYLNPAHLRPVTGDLDVILRVGSQDLTVSVPEPGTLALFGAGLFGLGFMRRRFA
jgi:hypothetical protein